MKISAKKYARALYEATVGLNEQEVEKVVKKFTITLAKKNGLPLVSQILAEFEGCWREAKGEIKADLTVAKLLDKEQIATFKKILEKRWGRTAELIQRVDSEIIGGGILQVGDTLIDGSLKQQLLSLKHSLINGQSINEAGSC